VGMVKLLVKKTRLLGGNIFYLSKNETPPLFVKTFGMTSGTSVRGTVGLTLMRKCFKCFNFYSIDRLCSTPLSDPLYLSFFLNNY
jgi:hypothetical protein